MVNFSLQFCYLRTCNMGGRIPSKEDSSIAMKKFLGHFFPQQHWMGILHLHTLAGNNLNGGLGWDFIVDSCFQ